MRVISNTSLKQSKRLLELGLNPDTSDMWWLYITAQGKHISMMHDEPDPHYLSRMKMYGIKNAAIPCWSLAALMELMPKIKEDEDDGGCYPILCKGYNTDKWHCVYRSSIHITEWCETSIDAAFDMMVWLLESGYINTEKK